MLTPALIRCRAVLLDMDGTLVDSTTAVTAQWGRWAARHGLALADVLAISHGVPAPDTMRRLLPHADIAAEFARFQAEEEAHEDAAGSVAVRHAVGFVSQLPPEKWAVVTSAPRTLARMRLAGTGFPAPRVLVAPDDVTRGKPDPEPYLVAARRLGVAAPDCLVVEDAPAGIASALAAGARVIAITTTYGAAELDCEIAIPDFGPVTAEIAGDELLIRVDRAGSLSH